MRLSGTFVRTLRDVGVESEFEHLQLALRAGFIRPQESGVYSFLPLGQRVCRNLIGLLEHLFAAQIIQTPTSNDELVEVSRLVAHIIRSYKQFPQRLSQVSTRRRDLTPRGGLVRLKEYTVFNSYHIAGTNHDDYREGINSFFEALDLPARELSGLYGGQTWIYEHPSGDDHFVECPNCGYTATLAAATFKYPHAEMISPETPLQKVKTPDCKTIQAVADFVGVPTSNTLKAVFFIHEHPTRAPRFVFGVIRGDLEVNEAKLIMTLGGVGHLRPATEDEIREVGAEPGYASPIGLQDVMVVVDESVVPDGAFVVGANEAGYHFTGAVPQRDFAYTMQADIALATDGAMCPQCEHRLSLKSGVELGYVAHVETRYSELVEANYLDENGKPQFIPLSVYRIGIDRLFAMLIEHHHDESGVIWPSLVAPFAVHLIQIGKKEDTTVHAEAVFKQLTAYNVMVLFDDRKDSPGIKFTDADLIGIPIRITISDRSLEQGGAEVSLQHDGEREVIPLATVIPWAINQS